MPRNKLASAAGTLPHRDLPSAAPIGLYFGGFRPGWFRLGRFVLWWFYILVVYILMVYILEDLDLDGLDLGGLHFGGLDSAWHRRFLPNFSLNREDVAHT